MAVEVVYVSRSLRSTRRDARSDQGKNASLSAPGEGAVPNTAVPFQELQEDDDGAKEGAHGILSGRVAVVLVCDCGVVVSGM